MTLVSVIIPTWNAEQYLRACLESVEAQTHTDVQVLIVDDESTDASPYIANQFVERDSRFQYLWQANRGPGPGGGRNGGLASVEGDWIFFLDADDLVTPEALAKLVAVGDRTGSDIVSGHVGRFRSGGHVWPTPNHSKSHEVALDRTHILKQPVLAYDTTAWNKLYRTSFWNGANRRFPERKLFEDIDPITRAQCESSSTDIISDQVYLWRIRDDQTSITQQVADVRTFADKLEQMTLAHAYLCDHGYTDVRIVFEEKSLTRDFLQGVNDVAVGDDDYLKLVGTEGADFLHRMLPASIEDLPVGDQLKFHLVSEGRLDDLRDVLTGGYETSSRTIHAPGAPGPTVVNDFAAALQPAVPVELTADDTEPQLILSRVFVDWGDDELIVRATASIPGLGGRLGHLDEISVRCRRAAFRFDHPAEFEPLGSGGLKGLVAGLQLDREKLTGRFVPQGRFVARIPLDKLSLAPAADYTEWRLFVTAGVRGLAREAQIPALNDDRLPHDRTYVVGDLSYEVTVTEYVNVIVRRNG